MTQLILRDLVKRYGDTQVLHAINLEVDQGEFVVLVGPSGCGKSTTLRMIAGLEEVSSGIIEIGGRVVNNLEPKERNIAMLFQNYAIYPHMTVRRNIGFGLKTSKLSKPEKNARIDEVAGILGMTEYLERKPAQLSGGQRQRVAIGRAMVRDPAVFLFDEPLSNLDAKLRTQLRAELKDLHRRLGATFVFVTHDQVEAMSLADRIVIMSNGQIEQIGTPMDLYENPASRFVAEFIGAPPMNVFDIAFPAGQAFAHIAGGTPKGAGAVGVRPEQLRIGREGVEAEVTLVEALGAETLVHLRIGDERVVLRDGHGSRIKVAQTLRLETDPGAILFFDKDGRAMAPAGKPALSVVD